MYTTIPCLQCKQTFVFLKYRNQGHKNIFEIKDFYRNRKKNFIIPGVIRKFDDFYLFYNFRFSKQRDV